MSFPSQESQEWLIASFRPGERPFYALSTALVPFLEPELDEIDRISKIKKLARKFTSGELNLTDIINAIVEKHPDSRLLLFADQFEELYTLCQNDDDHRRFLDELLSLLSISPSPQLPISVILTLRADFLGKAIAHRPFADVLQGADIVLGPMNRDELRETIERPANLLGVSIEDGLTDRILNAVGDEPGNLSLLEFALFELWGIQKNNMLTHAAYYEIGGVEKAIAQHAQKIYERFGKEEQAEVKKIFFKLTYPEKGVNDLRRLVRRDEFEKEDWELIIKLADHRLVITSRGESTQQETAEVVHEAIIREWKQLQDWLDEDREFLIWKERLKKSFQEWERNQHEIGTLLRGTPLNEAYKWLLERQDDLIPDEQQFIEESVHAKTRAQRRKTLLVTALFAAIIAVAVALFGLWRQATEERDQKEAERNNALKTQSRFLADLAQQQNEQGYFTHAILLALEALPEDMADPDRPYVPEAEVQLYGAITSQQERLILQGHEDKVYHAAFSPDGTRIVTASWDGTARVWEAASGRQLAVLRHEASVYRAAFSSDGVRIITASADGTARVWEAVSGQELVVVLRGHEDMYRATFSPDGTRIITTSNDGTARVWRVWEAESGRQLTVLRGHDQGVYYTAFSPDSTRIVTASDDGTVRVWEAESGRQLAVWPGWEVKSGQKPEGGLEGERVTYVIFSPDGTRFVTATWDGTMRVWEAVNAQVLGCCAGMKVR